MEEPQGPKKRGKGVYAHLYKTKDWYRLRWHQLSKQPLCEMCDQDGRTTAASVVDHIKPHRGDENLFRDPDNLQSLCKPCHDSRKAKIEIRGYDSKIDPLTGRPTDPNHPRNRQ